MTRAQLASFKTFHASQNPTAPPVLALSDAEAVELLQDAAVVKQLEHGKRVSEGFKALALVPAPPEDPDQLEAWALGKSAASKVLWDGLGGAVVDGVTLIRKRAS
ncbi:MAG: hypothetical protein ABI859_14180 [Pseudomonadota bacterium]